ncbi:hypothetical protein NQZ68_007078 [Dissostichus eleginoides]|nr:hypothetical protein NQZ68_007078 [Dissostichus eleginoides]
MPTPSLLHNTLITWGGGVTNARRLFINELGIELVMPPMKRRMEGTPHLQEHITGAMERCGLKTAHTPPSHRRTPDRRDKKELQDLPSWQRPKSQQLCVQGHKRVIVICEFSITCFLQRLTLFGRTLRSYSSVSIQPVNPVNPSRFTFTAVPIDLSAHWNNPRLRNS